MADIEKYNPTDFKIVSPLVSKLSWSHYLIITSFV